MTMPRPAICPKIPLIFPETRVAVTPFQSGYRLGSTMEFAGYDESLRPGRLKLLKAGSEAYLREPYCDPVLEEWFGWRPMTYDSVPIIDRSPAYQNVLIAAGHNMLGLSMATATGKLVAELAGDRPPHVDPRPYRVRRF
jgi:D-amino-acid dehydrogenase